MASETQPRCRLIISEPPLDSELLVMVTGSREWSFPVDQYIDLILLGVTTSESKKFKLIHGDCRGADTLAKEAAQRAGWSVQAYPAQWRVRKCVPKIVQIQGIPSTIHVEEEVYNPRAGFDRNQDLVDLNPHLVIAFHLRNSNGTRDCLKRLAQSTLKTAESSRLLKTLLVTESECLFLTPAELRSRYL